MARLGIGSVLLAILLLGCSGSNDDQYDTKAPPVASNATAPPPMTDKPTGASTHRLGSIGKAPGGSK